MSKGWDSVALKKLKALTGKGLSTSEIGKRLGMSKNAIVGKLNRMGWNLKALSGVATPANKVDTRSTKIVKKTKEPDSVTTKPSKKIVLNNKKNIASVSEAAKPVTKLKIPRVVKSVAGKESTIDTKSNSKTLAAHQRIVRHALDMAALKSNQCRWPIGDPDTESFHFCGKQAFIGKPYCYEHCKQAYQFTPPKKK